MEEDEWDGCGRWKAGLIIGSSEGCTYQAHLYVSPNECLSGAFGKWVFARRQDDSLGTIVTAGFRLGNILMQRDVHERVFLFLLSGRRFGLFLGLHRSSDFKVQFVVIVRGGLFSQVGTGRIHDGSGFDVGTRGWIDIGLKVW